MKNTTEVFGNAEKMAYTVNILQNLFNTSHKNVIRMIAYSANYLGYTLKTHEQRIKEWVSYLNTTRETILENFVIAYQIDIDDYTFVIRDNAIYCSHDIKSIIRFWQSGKRQILTDDIIMIEHHNTL